MDARVDGLAERLQRLTETALELNAPASVEGVLRRIAETATDLLGVELARVHLDEDGRRVSSGAGRGGSPPPRLEAALVDVQGERIGTIEVVDGQRAAFGDDDQVLLGQFAQVASGAISRARLGEQLAAQEAARFREELLSGISHDMQTPLATIVGLSDLLVRDDQLTVDEQHGIHETISRQAKALRGLVQQFLDFSRLESERPLLVRPRPVDVVSAIDRIVSLFEHQRDIVVGATHGLPLVLADPDRLDQVLSNIVSNAIKYSGEPVRIVASRRDDEVVIDVVDEGPGLAPHDQERLFEKFHRGESSAGTPGTGLGLYITRALVHAQGGRIDVHTNLGVGSRFTVAFPVAERDA